MTRPGARVATMRLLCGALVLALAPPAPAERADRNRETRIEADHQTVDDLNQVSVLTGHVILTKGTIRLTGDRMEYREDADGYQYAIVTSNGDPPATFHERRDPSRPGIEETVDGLAERIEYDGKADTVTLISHAQVRRFENGVLRDELSGARVVYDALNSKYDLNGAAAAEAPDRRVHVLIAPRAGAEAAPPAALKPEQPQRDGGR